MADAKISALNALTTADDADLFAVVDTSATETKKITKASMLSPIVISGANVGIGTSSPATALTVSAGSGNGIFVEDNNNSGSSPFAKVRGNRSIANGSQCFSGKLLLEGYETNAAVVSAKHLGTVAFGGNHTDGSAANILYPASISGISEGTFSDATTMPTALTFYTGSTGRADTTANVTFGTERMRITSTGSVGIGTSSPTNLLDVNADSIRVRTAQTPATAGAAGNQGEIAWDADYIYVCVATNTWKRVAIATW